MNIFLTLFWIFSDVKIHNGPPHDSNFGYSHAKRLIDITNRAYYEKHQHIYTSIVPCNIYGPNDNFHPEASHVIPGMIQRLYNIINDSNNQTSQEERVFTVYGTGKPLRQFIYSRDLAKLSVWVLREYESVSPIILSGNFHESLFKRFGYQIDDILTRFTFKQLTRKTKFPLHRWPRRLQKHLISKAKLNSIQPKPMDSSKRPRPIKSCVHSDQILNLPNSKGPSPTRCNGT